jgi:hypothetical protein
MTDQQKIRKATASLRQLPAIVNSLLAGQMGQLESQQRRETKQRELRDRIAAAKVRKAQRAELIPMPEIDPVKVQATRERLMRNYYKIGPQSQPKRKQP